MMSSAFLRPMLRPTGGLLGKTALRYHPNAPLRFTQPLSRAISTSPFRGTAILRPSLLPNTSKGLQGLPATTIAPGTGPTSVAVKQLVQVRMVASQVSNRPASQTLEHAATNVKEELGNSASDLAKTIAGANMASDSVVDSAEDSFFGITTKVASQVPEPVMVLGLTGGIPYIGASAMTVYLARQAGLASGGMLTVMDPGVASTLLDQALNFQVTYGAVMLSFLGALHWGFEMAAFGGQQGYARLALGTAPMLVAWTSLGMQPMEALALQWFAFTGLWYADAKATMAGWAPKWYSQYRFYLSILVGVCLIGSLAGTSYFGPVAGHGFLSHELEMLREERKKTIPKKHGLVPGPVEAIPAGPEAEHYTRIHDTRRDNEKK